MKIFCDLVNFFNSSPQAMKIREEMRLIAMEAPAMEGDEAPVIEVDVQPDPDNQRVNRRIPEPDEFDMFDDINHFLTQQQ
jgi:hypothetical protein